MIKIEIEGNLGIFNIGQTLHAHDVIRRTHGFLRFISGSVSLIGHVFSNKIPQKFNEVRSI